MVGKGYIIKDSINGMISDICPSSARRRYKPFFLIQRKISVEMNESQQRDFVYQRPNLIRQRLHPGSRTRHIPTRISRDIASVRREQCGQVQRCKRPTPVCQVSPRISRNENGIENHVSEAVMQHRA
jgi:hypothetical protein